MNDRQHSPCPGPGWVWCEYGPRYGRRMGWVELVEEGNEQMAAAAAEGCDESETLRAACTT